MNARSESLRVLIAGAGDGIGLACAEAFAARGAEVLLTDCDGIALTRTADRVGAFSRYCDAIGCSSVELFAEEIASLFPSIDVLINAAGRGYVRALAMTRMTRAMLPLLWRARGARLIVNVGSIHHATSDDIFPYASSPEAFEKLSRAFKEELRGSGIEVVTFTPGLTAIEAASARWSDRSDHLRIIDELNTAERIIGLVSHARPEWRQSPLRAVRRA